MALFLFPFLHNYMDLTLCSLAFYIIFNNFPCLAYTYSPYSHMIEQYRPASILETIACLLRGILLYFCAYTNSSTIIAKYSILFCEGIVKSIGLVRLFLNGEPHWD